jgi:hypothetical protein
MAGLLYLQARAQVRRLAEAEHALRLHVVRVRVHHLLCASQRKATRYWPQAHAAAQGVAIGYWSPS